MKFYRISLLIFMILIIASGCTDPWDEEEKNMAEITTIGLYPGSNGQYTILAGKSVDDPNGWGTIDSLLFIAIDTAGNEIISNGIESENNLNITEHYLLDDGNIMLFGNLNSDRYSWYYSTAVYAPTGTLVWNMDLASSTNGVIPSTSNDLFILGWEESDSGYQKITYAKIEIDGDTLWRRSIQTNSYSTSIHSGTPTSDGGCIAIGEFYISTRDRGTDMLVVRINSAGDTLWTGLYGGDRYDYAHSIRELNDGSFLLVGELSLRDSSNMNWNLNYGEQVYLVKISANGETLWTKAIGNTLMESANALIEMNDGSLILCGTRSQSYVYYYDTTVGWITKLNADGDQLWMKEFERKLPVGVRELDNGEILIVTNNLIGDYEWEMANNLNIMKFSSSGTLLWDEVLTP